MTCKSKASAKGTNQKRKTGAERGVRNVAYPELAGEGEKGTVIVPASKVKAVRGKYQSSDTKATVTDSGIVVLSPNAGKNIDAALNLHENNKKRYPKGRSKKEMINPNESKVIEIEPGVVYVTMEVSATPTYTANVYKKSKKGRWKKYPFSKSVAKSIKKKGIVKI